MRRLELSDDAFLDLGRIFDFMLQRELESAAGDPAVADRAVAQIMRQLRAVPKAPLIYRQVEDAEDASVRELAIRFGQTGFVAVFKVIDDERVLVLGVRHQREEAGR